MKRIPLLFASIIVTIVGLLAGAQAVQATPRSFDLPGIDLPGDFPPIDAFTLRDSAGGILTAPVASHDFPIDICPPLPWPPRPPWPPWDPWDPRTILIDFVNVEKLPLKHEQQFHNLFLSGLNHLGAARTTGDPELGLRYHGTALDLLTEAAATLQDVKLQVGMVGTYDLEKNEAIPHEQKWLTSAAQDLVHGITLLQEFVSGGSEKLRQEAAATFNQAYDQIVKKEAH